MSQYAFKPYILGTHHTVKEGEETCYVCSEKGVHSVRAKSDSDKSIDKIVELFTDLGLSANTVSTNNEGEQMIKEIYLGACSRHDENLTRLYDAHRETGSITLKSIVNSLK